MASRKRPLWRCPRCGHRFVTKNLWHSCGRYKLVDHFKGKPKNLRETFNKLVSTARKYGPLTVYAQKTRIVIQGRVRFCGATIKRDWLDAGLWLKRKVKHPRLIRVESYGNLGYGHHFRLQEPTDVDESLADLIYEAYAIGQQDLVKPK
jgi:hypothetical protein